MIEVIFLCSSWPFYITKNKINLVFFSKLLCFHFFTESEKELHSKEGVTCCGLDNAFPTKACFSDEMKAFSLLEMYKWALFLMKEIVYSCAWFGVACGHQVQKLSEYLHSLCRRFLPEYCLLFLFCFKTSMKLFCLVVIWDSLTFLSSQKAFEGRRHVRKMHHLGNSWPSYQDSCARTLTN